MEPEMDVYRKIKFRNVTVLPEDGKSFKVGILSLVTPTSCESLH